MPSVLYTYQSLANLTPDLADIASLGVKVVMNYYYTTEDSNAANVLAYLDALEAVGLKGCIDLIGLNQAGAEAVVAAVKDHAALWGYYLYDEPTTDVPAGTYATLYAAIKAVDPDRPILGVYPGYGAGFFPTGDARTAYTLSSDNQDIFGIDTYPVSSGGAYSEATFRTQVRAARGSVPDDVTRLTFALQTFTFGADPASPTPAQLASMETVVREEGWTSAGVLFFIWDVDSGSGTDVDDAYCLKHNTGLWDAVRKIATAYTSRERSLPFTADQFAEGVWTNGTRTLASGSASAPTDLNEFVAQELWTAGERAADMADTAPVLSVDEIAATDTDDLGNVRQGSSHNRTYTLRNTGDAALTIDETIVFSDDTAFGQGAKPPSIVLQPGETYSLTILVDTSTLGDFESDVTINSDDADSPYLFTMQMTVVEAVVGAGEAALFSGIRIGIGIGL